MKKNKGRLSMNNSYEFIEMSDLGEIAGVCYNCGSPIRYSCHLMDKQGEHYHVGTECAKTLAEASISNSYSMMETMREHKKIAEAYRMVEQNNHVKIFSGKDSVVIVGILGKTPKKIGIEPVFDMFTSNEYPFVRKFIDTYKDGNRNWCYAEVYNYLDSLKKMVKENE